jgi:hypothetical protein
MEYFYISTAAAGSQSISTVVLPCPCLYAGLSIDRCKDQDAVLLLIMARECDRYASMLKRQMVMNELGAGQEDGGSLLDAKVEGLKSRINDLIGCRLSPFLLPLLSSRYLLMGNVYWPVAVCIMLGGSLKMTFLPKIERLQALRDACKLGQQDPFHDRFDSFKQAYTSGSKQYLKLIPCDCCQRQDAWPLLTPCGKFLL